MKISCTQEEKDALIEELAYQCSFLCVKNSSQGDKKICNGDCEKNIEKGITWEITDEQ